MRLYLASWALLSIKQSLVYEFHPFFNQLLTDTLVRIEIQCMFHGVKYAGLSVMCPLYISGHGVWSHPQREVQTWRLCPSETPPSSLLLTTTVVQDLLASIVWLLRSRWGSLVNLKFTVCWFNHFIDLIIRWERGAGLAVMWGARVGLDSFLQ